MVVPLTNGEKRNYMRGGKNRNNDLNASEKVAPISPSMNCFWPVLDITTMRLWP